MSWLQRTLWFGPPPSTEHLPKKTANTISEPVPVRLPDDLLDDDFSIEEIEIMGVPDDVILSAGTHSGSDIWQLTPEQSQNLTLTSSHPEGRKVLLTFKAVGTELSSQSRLTNMASENVDISEALPVPPKPKSANVLNAEKKAEKNARKEHGRIVQEKLEKEAQEKAKRKAQERAERKAREKAEFKVQEKAERKAKEKEERKAQERAERKAKEKEERKALEKAERKAKEKEGRKAQERAERKAREKAEQKEKDRAERKAREKEERKAQERAGRKAREKAEREAKEKEAREKARTPGELRKRTGTIAVRLGGAPEYGDPLYRVSVDGRQIANGNVDWALGMPDIAEGELGLICWQDVTIPWDFDSHIPGDLSITFENDHTWSGETPENLIVDWVNIDGVQITPDSPFAKASGGLVPWPNADGYSGWRGDLTFNIAAAFAGTTETSTAPVVRGKPLIIRVSDKDCANPEVMAEFFELRQYLRGVDDPESKAEPSSRYASMGLAEAGWRDLVVLDPDGNAVSLDPVTPPFIIRVSASDVTDTDVLVRLSGLRSYLQGYEVLDQKSREGSGFFKLGLAQKGWRDLLVLDPDGAAVSLPEIPAASRPEGHIDRAGAEDIKRKYLAGIVKRGLDEMERALRQGAPKADQKTSAEEPIETGGDQRISKRDARKRVKAFYNDALKHALDRLQASIGEDVSDIPPPEKASKDQSTSQHI